MEEDAPLLYMTFWEHQQAMLVNELGARRLELPDEHELQVNEKKGARIASACYETDKFRKVRVAWGLTPLTGARHGHGRPGTSLCRPRPRDSPLPTDLSPRSG